MFFNEKAAAEAGCRFYDPVQGIDTMNMVP